MNSERYAPIARWYEEDEPTTIPQFFNIEESSIDNSCSKMSDFERIALEIGSLVTEKNRAYGNSAVITNTIVNCLYPNGIPPEAYPDALLIIRVIDKLMRIATDKDAFGESPWRDIAGYSLIALRSKENASNLDKSHDKS